MLNKRVKFDQIHAGIKYIYRQNTSVIGGIPTDKHATFDLKLERVPFFHAAMQANVFSTEKTHQHILFWREIRSFVSTTDRN